MRTVCSGGSISEALGAGVQIKLNRVIVGQPVLERLAQLPAGKILLADILAPLRTQRNPLLELARSFRHRLRLVSVGEAALVAEERTAANSKREQRQTKGIVPGPIHRQQFVETGSHCQRENAARD